MGIHADHRRRARAAYLRAEGLSFEAIGRRLGVTRQCAYALALAPRAGHAAPAETNPLPAMPRTLERDCGSEASPPVRGLRRLLRR
jgi:hypothetical protein